MLGSLRAHNEQQHLYDDIGYWAATESTAEVDFVLTRDRRHLAIEVKAAERYHTAMLKGLRAVADLPGLARRILTYRGRRSFRTEDGIDRLGPRRPAPGPPSRRTLALNTPVPAGVLVTRAMAGYIPRRAARTTPMPSRWR